MSLDRRIKFLIVLISSILVCGVIGLAMAIVLPAHNFPIGIEVIKKIGFIFIALSVIQILIYLIYWFFYHKGYKGMRYAFVHANMMRKLRLMILEASSKHTTQEYAGEERVAKLPRIQIIFDDGMTRGKVIIGNSIRHHKLLEDMNISSALGKYIVSEQYFSDDMNTYVYEFELAETDQLAFKNYKDFQLLCSKQENGTLFIDDRNRVPLHHTLIVGSTGSGKTYATYSLILQLLNFSTVPEIYFADPKCSALYVVGKSISCDKTAGSTNEIVFLLQRFYEAMQKREQESQEYLNNKLDSDFKDWGLQAHVLIIDEFSSFQSVVNTLDKFTRDRVNMYLTNIIQKGRQLGFFMWIIMQKSDSKILPTYLRDNLVFKVVLGQATDTTYQTAFEEYADLPKRNFQQGQGLYTFQGLTRQPKVCSFPTLKFDILKAVRTR